MQYDEEKYPMIWLRPNRRGFCFTASIPCRMLERSGKRIKIAALLVGGGEKERLVDQTDLRHVPCRCFSECRAFERLDPSPAPPATEAEK